MGAQRQLAVAQTSTGLLYRGFPIRSRSNSVGAQPAGSQRYSRFGNLRYDGVRKRRRRFILSL
jgi:hypothetical protein